MENKNLIYFLAGFGTVSLIIYAYGFMTKKPQVQESVANKN